MPTAVNGNTNVNYDIRGSGSPVTLFNHSGTSNLSWSEVFLEILATTHIILAPDHRGTGLSGPATEYTIADLAADGFEVLKAEDIERPVVVGTSMGGAVAQAFSLNYSEHVESLVLIGTFAGASVRVAPEPWVNELYRRGFQETDIVNRWRMLLPTIYGKRYLERHEEVALELELKGLRYTTAETMKWHGNAVGKFDAYDRLPALKARTLVVHGDEDPIIPLENGKILADIIQDSELVVLEGLGHLPASESPVDVSQLIERFIAA